MADRKFWRRFCPAFELLEPDALVTVVVAGVKWTTTNHPWRRRFAWLPVSLSDGPTRTTVWLDWYWSRFGGDCTEISLTDPTEKW